MIPDNAARFTTRAELHDCRLPGTTAPTTGWHALREADRACCCSAKPLVVVIMPSAVSRDHPTDLLLCGHHYRAAGPALVAAGATVFDQAGQLIGQSAQDAG